MSCRYSVGLCSESFRVAAGELARRELDDRPQDIAVKNISGNVALNGTVATYPQYREAAAAQRVSGVTAVHNHLQVVLDHDHYRDDALLTTAANNALMADVGVPDGVEAIAADGNITLTGTVGSGVQRAAAAEAVSGLMGVRNVNNDLEVASTADAYSVNVHVQEALERYRPGAGSVQASTPV